MPAMSWLNDVGTQHPPGFWDLPEDVWTRIRMDLSSAIVTKDKRNWAIIKMKVDWGHGFIDSVLEFWSHSELAMFLAGRDSGSYDCQVKRTKIDGKNQVRFQVV